MSEAYQRPKHGKFYKLGSGLLYSGFILMIFEALWADMNGFGVSISAVGEILLTVSSIQSTIYCSKVNIERKKGKYQYFVSPLIKDGGFGLSLVLY